MLERFKRSPDDPEARRTGAVATAERDRDTVGRDGAADGDRSTRTRTGNGAATASALATARARQREEFGGINWGASFFGWLVAVGVGALLTSMLDRGRAAIGLTATTDPTNTSSAEELSLAGSDRAARRAHARLLRGRVRRGADVALRRRAPGHRHVGDRARVTVTLAVAGVILGRRVQRARAAQHARAARGRSVVRSGGLIALAAILVGTLIAALSGGKVGERYHKRVDRAGFVD